MAGKYYWLKLPKDFFKSHEIRIVEGMPNGDKYILFYLKLLTESIPHEGRIRFSETIPYDEQMLSTITETDLEIVRTAIKVFQDFNMVELWDDGTYFMTKISDMIGSETEWAKKKREHRENVKKENDDSSQVEDIVPSLSSGRLDNVRTESDKRENIEKRDKNLEKEKSIKKEKTKPLYHFSKPSIEEIHGYCISRDSSVNPQKFFNYYESNGWKVGRNPMRDWKAAIRNWEQSDKNGKKPDQYNMDGPRVEGF